MQYRRMFIWTLIKRSVYRLLQFFVPKNQEKLKHRQEKINKMIQLKFNMAQTAIQYLKDHMTAENENIYLVIIGEYTELILKFQRAKNGENSYTHMQRELREKAFQAERDEIQNMYEEGEITIDIIRKIRKQINIREAYWMEENSVRSH
jgi:CPA1 family monovalent cation:H+ antiporter